MKVVGVPAREILLGRETSATALREVIVLLIVLWMTAKLRK